MASIDEKDPSQLLDVSIYPFKSAPLFTALELRTC